MTIELFPPSAPALPIGFGLVRDSGRLELPSRISIGEHPIHVVHSDPAQIAVLAALAGLQCWTMGLGQTGPPLQRRPILLITERPAAVAAAYLELKLARGALRPLSQSRRVSLFGLGLPVPDKRGTLWDVVLEGATEDIRLHNLFPAFALLRTGSDPKAVAAREHLGRGDEEGPALLIVRSFDDSVLRDVCGAKAPVLALIDLPATSRLPHLQNIPTLVFHDSVFAPGLSGGGGLGGLVLLPDSRLELFARMSRFSVVEPSVPESARDTWQLLDGALQLLVERVEERHHSVLRECMRIALRLREILLQLPVGLIAFEQSLVLSGLPESLWDGWSAVRLLQTLENRGAEVSALGEWEAMVFNELVAAFRTASGMLAHQAPKTDSILASTESGRTVVVISTSRVVAAALNASCGLLPPLGLGISDKSIRAVAQEDLAAISPNDDCVVHHAFEPSSVLGGLVRAGPRKATFILLPNELRFLSGRLAGLREAVRVSEPLTKLLAPFYAHLDRLPAVAGLRRGSAALPLIAQADFESYRRLFERGRPHNRLGTVLTSSLEPAPSSLHARVDAFMVQLGGRRVVLLEAGSRVTVVGQDDTINRKMPDALERGDRLISVDADAREAIVHPVLAARAAEEVRDGLMAPVTKWREELREGRERLGLTYDGLLENLRARGSRLSDAAAIGAWIRGQVLGPLDPKDVLRVGEIIGSSWITSHAEEVGVALLLLRTGHRLLGRQMTRLIERAAVGDTEVSKADFTFLDSLGITMAALQDAVELLAVEAVSAEAGVDIARIGQVFSLDEEVAYGGS